jgi:predicted RNA binding protein YcfA (HicA-like mRNA interferase family)
MKYDDLFKLLRQNGWIEIRQKGSHIIMNHPPDKVNLIVPYHAGKEVKKGLLQSIIKKADIKTTKR